MGFLAGLVLCLAAFSIGISMKSPSGFALSFFIAGLTLVLGSWAGLRSWSSLPYARSTLRDNVRCWRDQVIVPAWLPVAFYAIMLGAILVTGAEIAVFLVPLLSGMVDPAIRTMYYAWTLPDPTDDGTSSAPLAELRAPVRPPGPASVVLRRLMILIGIACYLLIGLAHAPTRQYFGEFADGASGFCFVAGVAITIWLCSWIDDAARKKAEAPRPLYDVLQIGPISWGSIFVGCIAVMLFLLFIVAGGTRQIASLAASLSLLVGTTLYGAGFAWKKTRG